MRKPPKNLTPEQEAAWREEKKAQAREYAARPEVKARAKSYYAREEVKAKARANHAKPEVKAKIQRLRKTAKFISWRRNYLSTPEVKARKQKQSATLNGKAARIAYNGRRRSSERVVTIGNLKEIKVWLAHWKSSPIVTCHWCILNFHPDQCRADHVMPLAKGGLHCRSNMVIACVTCNLRKNAKHPDEWIKQIETTAMEWEPGLE